MKEQKKYKYILGIAFIVIGLLVYCIFACGKPKRVLFVTIDTLRADHLKTYNYPINTAPFIESLADESTVFDYALSASSHTAPSHTTMFTSLYPYQHGVLANHDTFKGDIPTIYSVFSSAKVPVAAFPATRFMDGKVSFPAISEKDDIESAKVNREIWYRRADTQVDRVINWFNKFHTGKDYFVWLHFYDVHAWGNTTKNGASDEDFNAVYPSDEAQHVKFLNEKHAIPSDFHGSDKKLIKAMNSYDGRLYFVDRQIKRLADYLKAKDLWYDSIVVITSDHGEGLGNHNYAGHGQYLYQEQLHIPLIIHRVGSQNSNRVSKQVRSVDFFPTISDLVGLKIPFNKIQRQGVSLKDFILNNSDVKTPEMSFAQRRPRDEARIRRNWQEGEFYALQNKQWKILWHSDGKHEVYNLEEDPFELKNVYELEDGIFKHHNEVLQKLLKIKGLGKKSNPLEELNESELEELRSLGYL